MATKKLRSEQVRQSTTKDTRTRLIQAAMEEFNEGGFFGTDTNRIARRAGFAPQTFYRWFDDKIAVFIAAYRAWEDAEAKLIGELVARNGSTKQLIRMTIEHHRRYLVFRRSLRQLAVEHKTVREARAASRLRRLRRSRNGSGAMTRATNLLPGATLGRTCGRRDGRYGLECSGRRTCAWRNHRETTRTLKIVAVTGANQKYCQ
jgi:AcrR family transcriptional regulator